MTSAPSPAVILFGTDEPVPPQRILKAGKLSAELDAGNLRHIRFGGVEIIRAISFIVRDHNWGTYNPVITDLAINGTDAGLTVTYKAVARDERQSFSYAAEITLGEDGTLAFAATGAADTAFLTNRTGFVVLHPSAASGLPVTIEHADGVVEEGRFPESIDPVQPMMNLRALIHEAAPGLRVSCRMEGDVYEMEDQRNWTDVSYKTYVRPLALPWPYTLAEGEVLQQAVRLDVSGQPAQAEAAGAGITVHIGEAVGVVPPLGLGLDPDEVDGTTAAADTLQRIGARHLVGFYDPRRGHDRETLRGLAAAARSIGAEPWLEAVIVSVDGYAEELAALGREVATLGSPFPVVLVSPAPDLKCTLPGSPWPPAPPPRDFFAVARKAFPGTRLGGGMFSYFTEMNRKRPPSDLLDIASFTTTAMLHAGDDHSITEGLESLPAMALSAEAIAAGKPWAVGPSAIGMRMNPYGEAPMANPGNIRQAMNFNDPRQRGLLGAAWTLGFFARFAAGGASSITLGGTTGAFGLLHRRHPWPQPWFDEHGGLFPVFHVLKGLAGLGGATMRRVVLSEPSAVQGIAVERADGIELWLANLTGADQAVQVEGTIAERAVLDAGTFVAATKNADALALMAEGTVGSTCTLAPYAVARLRLN
ncbi:D-apionate lactonase [Hyphomicrobiales bacterium]|nr:D-apionate lactonase [Hyphomicrobiales bacterium]CAH1674772.1 D-apionate lactonase [Hyphomicrobiales bacterium]